jgi:hypothetical protein
MVINCSVIGSCLVCAARLSPAKALRLNKQQIRTTVLVQTSVLQGFIKHSSLLGYFHFSSAPL